MDLSYFALDRRMLVDLFHQMDPTMWLLEKETFWMVVGSLRIQALIKCVSPRMGRMGIT